MHGDIILDTVDAISQGPRWSKLQRRVHVAQPASLQTGKAASRVTWCCTCEEWPRTCQVDNIYSLDIPQYLPSITIIALLIHIKTHIGRHFRWSISWGKWIIFNPIRNHIEKEDTKVVGLSGLGITCLPRNQRFVGSNPAEVDGFFQDIKILSTSPPGGTLNWGSPVWDFRLVKEPKTWKNRPLSKI